MAHGMGAAEQQSCQLFRTHNRGLKPHKQMVWYGKWVHMGAPDTNIG